MTRPPKTRRLWTRDEDEKLTNFKTQHPNLPWGEIIKLANLRNRDEKSCSHRWINYLRPEFNKGEFSPQEDELIIRLKSAGVSWASMVKDPLLEQRSANALKNRWNNHLVKRLIINLGRHLLTDDETSDHFVPEDDLKARMTEFHSNVHDLNAISLDDKTSDHHVRRDDLEASTSGSTDLIRNHDPNALHSIMETYTR